MDQGFRPSDLRLFQATKCPKPQQKAENNQHTFISRHGIYLNYMRHNSSKFILCERIRKSGHSDTTVLSGLSEWKEEDLRSPRLA